MLSWVSEWAVSNGTSAQLGYTVPFMSVYAGKYVTKDKLKIQTIHRLNTTQKRKQHKIQQNKTSLVACYDRTWTCCIISLQLSLWPFTRCSFHSSLINLFWASCISNFCHRLHAKLMLIFCAISFAVFCLLREIKVARSLTVLQYSKCFHLSSEAQVMTSVCLSVCLYCNACVKTKGEHSEHSAVRQLSIICYENLHYHYYFVSTTFNQSWVLKF